MALYDHSCMKGKSLKFTDRVKEVLAKGDLNSMVAHVSKDLFCELRHGCDVPADHQLVGLSYDFIRKADGEPRGSMPIVKRWFHDTERGIIYTGYQKSNKNMGTEDEPNWVRKMTTEQEAFNQEAFGNIEDLREAGIFLIKIG